MSLLALPALLLLLSVVVLVALATWSRGPRRREVGTLFIWRRVAAGLPPRRQRKRHLDPLLWLLLSAAVAASIAAARPAWLAAEPAPRVAVYIERLEPAGPEPELDQALARAREAAPGAELTFFMVGGVGEVVALNPGPPEAEMAQFLGRSEAFEGRVLLLHTPGTAAEYGRVLPRVTESRRDVMFGLGVSGEQIVVRTAAMTPPQATGAMLTGSSDSADESVSTWVATANQVSLRLGGRVARLEREPFVVGLGEDWTTDAHFALYNALGTDSAREGAARLWLTGQLEPAVRIHGGDLVLLEGAELSFDAGHPLFHDLPLEDFDWLREGRVMQPDPSARPLLSVEREGKPVGDIIRMRGGNLEFAGDPFIHAPIASAALLLDNAVGVVAGVRASERPGYRLVSAPLPSRRAALSAPFAPVGELDLSRRREAELEFSSWLMLAAAVLLAVAAWRASGSGPRRP